MRFRFLFCLMAIPLFAGEVQPGHSSHGEAFNEGPRQAAVLMDGMGKVNFAVTTEKAEARRFFNQGVAQLHGFWYYEAERSFRQAAMFDPDCAMAYWGCAMANVNNENRAKGFIAEAVKRRDKSSPREQAWINALNRFYDESKRDNKQRHLDFIEDLEGIAQEHPEDMEARAFLGWAIWKSKDGGVPMVSRESVDVLLQQVLDREPMHPAHHYRIHLWDTGKAKRALDSAGLCGQSAPGIAHMWHMPAHTYSKTNRQMDSAWQQEAAIRVDHAYVARTRVLTDQIHNYAHNAEWLIRSWNHLGRAGESTALARNLLSMPRHPAGNTLEKGNTSASHGRNRLIETLLKFELWDQMLELEESPLLDVTPNRDHEIARLRAMGVAAYFSGDAERLGSARAKIQSLQKASPKKQAKNKETKKTDEKKEPSDAEKALAELKILEMILGRKPVSETLAALEKADGLPNERLARYYQTLDQEEKAVAAANKLPADAPGQALKAEVLLAFGKQEEARKAMDKAGIEGASMDAGLPFSKKLDAMAQQLGMKESWRKAAPVPQDAGVRPALASLGPLHWRPVKALPLLLADADGHAVNVDSAPAGKPRLVIFYLSGQCSHCVQQLKAFHAVAAKARETGIEMIAVGNESREELLKTAKLVSPDGKPAMKLLADPELTAFKAWRCYDDFEASPLHGTFLLDAEGHIRWQDVSYTPFDNTTFFMAEAVRLLAIEAEGN